MRAKIATLPPLVSRLRVWEIMSARKISYDFKTITLWYSKWKVT